MKLKFTAASQTFLLHTCILKTGISYLLKSIFWRGFHYSFNSFNT
ncbi:hypothetical protein HMPREF3156_01206 [Neisseria sp. HMSC06F02]|nr:hypothetical protein HMPREF3156_01206 [Neisseria sp. HMSC06F02]